MVGTYIRLSGFAGVLALFSCAAGPNDNSAPITPKRVYSPESVVIESGQYSEGNNLVGERPVLLLDYIPSEPGKAALAAGCLQALPGDFELGYAVCQNEARQRMPIYARNVDQRCNVGGQEALIPASESLISAECNDMTIRTFLFDPPLRVLVLKSE